MSEKQELLTTNRKALTINLDGTHYGTIAEIGAGQEVARIFFQVGSASGAIAKTMSAYDMTFSDSIYGKAPRYVSRERLQTMLDHEYRLLKERLAGQRGERTRFFVFADTVAAKSTRGTSDGHGWLGIRFQREPLEEPNDILIHVRMWDKKNVLQQEALGIVGVNLIYGAFNYHDDPRRLIRSLVDNVGTDRIEVDMLKFSGPAFQRLDHRLLSLHLVRHGLTNAVLFAPGGEMLLPFEAFNGKAVLMGRGSFRPVTHVGVDMFRTATAQFREEPLVREKDVVVLAEMGMDLFLEGGAFDADDFLARADLLGMLGLTTLVSNYTELHRLVAYFRRYTTEMVGVTMGVANLAELFDEKQHEQLDGGILEFFGRMLRHAVKIYIYPMRRDAYAYYFQTVGAGATESGVLPVSGDLITADNLLVSPHLRHLYAHLLENRHLAGLVGCNEAYLGIFARDVLERIRRGDTRWEQMVPAPVATLIKERRLFTAQAPSSTLR